MQPSDYGFGDRLLHRVALGKSLVSRASFDMDDLAGDKSPDHPDERHVFVSGLARGGTTILMRALYATGQFRSLTYRDMPFVLMPGLWRKLSASFQRHADPTERAHGDGILVDFDSPEAFEEVFWRVFSGGDYIGDDSLRPHEVGDELIDQFRTYVRRIVASSGGGGPLRYLSKNNNNILRLGAIRKTFPEALILIPFRDPLQHAVSLLNQHTRFCDRHASDGFSRDYMRWLGHHEFGSIHKPFRFPSDTQMSGRGLTATDVNYWLDVWARTYRYLLDAAPPGGVFVCFEDLCDDPVNTLGPVFGSAALWLDEGQLKETFRAPAAKRVAAVDDALHRQAQAIYLELRTRATSQRE